jgi:hypothetical protein
MNSQGAKGVFLVVIKILPLAIYLRSACCKFGLPYLGCDGDMCPGNRTLDPAPLNHEP